MKMVHSPAMQVSISAVLFCDLAGQILFCYFFLLLVLSRVCIALLLGLSCSPALSQDEQLSCNSLYTPAQREMCREIPDLLRILVGAEQQALIECEKVFFHQPWNCSDFSVIKPSIVMQYGKYRQEALKKQTDLTGSPTLLILGLKDQ